MTDSLGPVFLLPGSGGLNQSQVDDRIAAASLSGDQITSGTVADARIASTIARDSEITTALAAAGLSATQITAVSALITTAMEESGIGTAPVAVALYVESISGTTAQLSGQDLDLATLDAGLDILCHADAKIYTTTGTGVGTGVLAEDAIYVTTGAGITGASGWVVYVIDSEATRIGEPTADASIFTAGILCSAPNVVSNALYVYIPPGTAIWFDGNATASENGPWVADGSDTLQRVSFPHPTTVPTLVTFVGTTTLGALFTEGTTTGQHAVVVPAGFDYTTHTILGLDPTTVPFLALQSTVDTLTAAVDTAEIVARRRPPAPDADEPIKVYVFDGSFGGYSIAGLPDVSLPGSIDAWVLCRPDAFDDFGSLVVNVFGELFSRNGPLQDGVLDDMEIAAEFDIATRKLRFFLEWKRNGVLDAEGDGEYSAGRQHVDVGMAFGEWIALRASLAFTTSGTNVKLWVDTSVGWDEILDDIKWLKVIDADFPDAVEGVENSGTPWWFGNDFKGVIARGALRIDGTLAANPDASTASIGDTDTTDGIGNTMTTSSAVVGWSRSGPVSDGVGGVTWVDGT